jgi:hypothetical protein
MTTTNTFMQLASRVIVGSLLPRIDQAAEASVEPFRTPQMLRPNLASKRYGWTHYGIFLPSLPAPLKYCNLMTLLGATGTIMFDNDYLVTSTPRDTATLLSSTAAGDTHHYSGYSIERECQAREDGSLVQFGDNLTISGTYPSYRVQAAYLDFKLDLSIECTDTVSWFVRNLVYDHLSLLATCSGTIEQGEVKLDLDRQLCTFEYARCFSPYALTQRILPQPWKLPADFFTYQIINLDETTQLLLTEVRSLGRVAFKGVHVRALDGRAEIYVDDVDFKVLEYQKEAAVAPDGGVMQLPRRISWVVRQSGATVLEIAGEIDSPWRHGHGQGYVACYRFAGAYRGKQYAGTGYIEYIDCEAS